MTNEASTQTDSDEQAGDEPVLSLSTLAPVRPTINIDGELYELRVLEHDFSADEHARFQADLGEFDGLWERKKRSAAQGTRMSMLLARLVDQVVTDLPKAVKAALSDEQKRQVVVTFQLAPALVRALAQQKEMDAEKADGETPTTGT